MRAIVIFITLLIVVILFYQYLMRYFYFYKITERGIKIKFVGIPIYFIPFTNIKETKIISMKEFYFMNPFLTIRFGNRLWSKNALLIKRKIALIRNIIITPQNPESFLIELTERINQ